MVKPTCTEDGCPDPFHARGWCKYHYQRWQRYGDPSGVRLTVENRFWSKVNKNGPIPEHRPDLGPCWIWTAKRASGYGRFSIGAPPNNEHPAHRLSYEWLVGPIPDGLEPDHLCRVRPCVRPSHLEPVTRQVNLLRGDTIPASHAAKTHCPKGHAYDLANTRWEGRMRHCRACAADYQRRLRAKRSSPAASRPPLSPPGHRHGPQGHANEEPEVISQEVKHGRLRNTA